MAALQPLCYLIGVNPQELLNEENILLEAELFLHVCYELKEKFRDFYKNYFRLMKFNKDMEDMMLETNFVRLVIQDIVATEEYDLQGIAYYTHTHVDVIEEIVTGLNVSPSGILLQRLIDLHRTVRQDLYLDVGRRITVRYLSVA